MTHRVYETRRRELLTFNQLEAKFGLKPANGMTAYRMIRLFEKRAMEDG